ncbi:MAG: porin [bacterium]
MARLKAIVFLSIVFIGASDTLAQSEASELRIFGYFQNSFIHQTGFKTEFDQEAENNSFAVQQLNLFFQKDLARNWRAFVNFEFLNNFSSSRQWGDANLEEAWVRFRANEKFNLKLGLLIPIFNNLNEIKNRTPLLPYVIRPIVYETSFQEFIAVEEYLPARAFVQAYGFIPIHELKFDYAFYLGNSPNINNRSDIGQTGVDSTDTFLIGGRIGARFGELKIGLSGTRENVNGFPSVEAVTGNPPVYFNEVPRTRLGGDLSYHLEKFSFEAEFIIVTYDDDMPEVCIDKTFYYGTLGYQVTEQLFVYASYWVTEEEFTQELDFLDAPVVVSGKSDIKVPTIGVSYNLNDRVTLKGQFAPVDIEPEIPSLQLRQEIEFNHYSIAASVFF